MAASVSELDVILEGKDDKNRPSCPHGPTLLFVRYNKDGDLQQFYACSAFRDRKDCNFFQLKDEKLTDIKKSNRKLMLKEMNSLYIKMKKRCHKLRKLKAVARVFCETCCQFLLPEERGEHSQHRTRSNIDDHVISRPSKLFQPLDNNKTYAQYLFSESAVEFTIKLLKKLKMTHVLCIGAPRIHEAVQCDIEGGLHSLLLDLDQRYQQVYPPKKFCHYNMFNHHFFNNSKSEDVFTYFVTENEHVAIVTDPPFGGLVEVLAATFGKISGLWKSSLKGSTKTELPILWFFPYFMEKRIIECLPQFSMLDYKVDYDNHALFRGDVKKHGSPVRLFTNIPPADIELPSEEGYWFCKDCKRYSGRENVHCPACNSCTSKDGRTYRHCFKCERCVKPSKVHCDKCNVCQLKDHQCGKVTPKGCHICGELDHKRKDCPNKGKKLKRKKSSEDIRPYKKKKNK